MIKKIQCVCGSGLGSSFLVEMNVKKALKKFGLSEIEVDHSSATDVYKGSADLYVCGKDMLDTVKPYGPSVVLSNIISASELEEKLEEYLKKEGVF